MDNICFLISVCIFAVSVFFTAFLSYKPYKRSGFVKPFYILVIGVFVAATVMFIPLNYPLFKDHAAAPLTTLLASAHTAIRLFIVDCDFEIVFSQTAHMGTALKNSYIVLSTILFVLSPVLTASVVLSFFENLSAKIKYFFCFFKDTYIFSELNERSLSLAKSLKNGNKRRLIIFTDVFKKDDETSFELIERAKEIDSILFKSDITIVNFRVHSKKSKLYFFIIGNDEVENINQTIRLTSSKKPQKFSEIESDSFLSLPHRNVKGYDYPRKDTRVYVFSTNTSSEQHLSAINPKYLKLRRVSDIQSLVYKLLYNDGMQIFDSALPTGNTVYCSATKTQDEEKKISAVILGLGGYGTEMAKALAWFSQMHPYKLELNIFDIKKHADSAFQSSYPDLFDINPAKKPLPPPEKDEDGNYKEYPFRNGDYTTPGEAHYKISIHTGFDADSFDFDKKLKEISDATYVFISLGDDDKNIRAASKVRILMKRMGRYPVIHTIVYNPNKQDMLRYGHTVSGQSYDIQPFGDISSTYSEDCILNSELEKRALGRHLAYVYQVADSKGLVGEERERVISAEEETFWKYDYNYRSSTASVIHSKFKVMCNVPGSEKAPNDRTEDEKWFFREMEHKRWNAYVRSEGFVACETKEQRDKLAKTHHLLVPFKKLPYDEQIKDDN